MFTGDYRRLAHLHQPNDVATLRTYIEQTGQARLEMGAPAESLIAIAALMEENVRRLINTELAPYPNVARDTTRRVQAAIRNIRMILKRSQSAADHQRADHAPLARREARARMTAVLSWPGPPSHPRNRPKARCAMPAPLQASS